MEQPFLFFIYREPSHRDDGPYMNFKYNLPYNNCFDK